MKVKFEIEASDKWVPVAESAVSVVGSFAQAPAPNGMQAEAIRGIVTILGEYLKYKPPFGSGMASLRMPDLGDPPPPSVPHAPLRSEPGPTAFVMPGDGPSALDDEPDHPFQADNSVAGPGPKAATAETNAAAEAGRRHQDKLVLGYETFRDLLFLWVQGFGKPDMAQPDRAGAMKELAEHPQKAGAILRYVQACGGLEATCRACLNPKTYNSEKVRQIAETITQVASILFPDLADTLEPVARKPALTPS